MSQSRRNWLSFHAAVLLLVLSPLILVTYVPMVDLPNHIGRGMILLNLSHSKALQTFYSYRWAFVPNLAFDMFMLLVGQVVGALLAAKLFCILAAGSLYIGTVLLHRVLHGHFSLVPAAAAVLVYNGAFHYGFVTYVFGVGLSLCAVAAWLHFRGLPLKFHAPLFASIGVGLVWVHLYAFGLFGLVVLGFELDRVIAAWRRRHVFPRSEALNALLVGLAPAVVPVALFFLISPTGSEVSRTYWGTVWWKIEGLTEPLVFYFTTPEVLTAAAFLAVFGWLILTRIVVFDRRTVLPLSLLILAFLLMPRMLFGSSFAEYRMPAAIALFALAFLDWRPAAASYVRNFGGGFILALAAAKVLLIGQLWLSWQPALAAYSQAFALLPPGAVMLTMEATHGSASLDRRPPITHMQSLATARGAFVPTLFADEPGYLLHFNPPYRALKHFEVPEDPNPQFARFGAYYTYLLVQWPEFARLPSGPKVREIASGPTFALYKVEAASANITADVLNDSTR